MNFDNQTQKCKFIAGIKELLQFFYGTKDLNSAYRKKLESKIDGFIAAGILIDLISKPELQAIIDTEHMSAFGMTRDERREKLKFQSKGVAIDWDIYDIPTIHRK
jgi:hypothetical protein